ncbi:MAG: RNA deprotection pyrophosphohydrolase [Bacillus sp. (in: firmicutes)]
METFFDVNGNRVSFSDAFNPFSSAPDHVLVLLSSKQGWVFTLHKTRGLEFPGGKREEGETIEQAARREVWEETGAHLQELVYIGQYKVEGEGRSFVKNVYFSRVDFFEWKEDYLETEGAVLMEELPDDFSDESYSFIMRDKVITLCMERIKDLRLI